jgi:hypothetical protein
MLMRVTTWQLLGADGKSRRPRHSVLFCMPMRLDSYGWGTVMSELLRARTDSERRPRSPAAAPRLHGAGCGEVEIRLGLAREGLAVAVAGPSRGRGGRRRGRHSRRRLCSRHGRCWSAARLTGGGSARRCGRRRGSRWFGGRRRFGRGARRGAGGQVAARRRGSIASGDFGCKNHLINHWNLLWHGARLTTAR